MPLLKLGGGSGNGSPVHARLATSTPTKGFPEYPNVYPGLTALQASRASDGVAMLDRTLPASDAEEVRLGIDGAETPPNGTRTPPNGTTGMVRGQRTGWLLGLRTLAERVALGSNRTLTLTLT